MIGSIFIQGQTGLNYKTMKNTELLVPVILAGGYGSRLGYTEKASLNIHGVPQYQYLSSLLGEYFEEIIISLRTEQMSLFSSSDKMDFVPDVYEDCGPLGGVVSCMEYCKKSVLVLACDMPNISDKAILNLIENRNTDKSGTVYKLTASDQLQPLFAIYEYHALDYFQELLVQKKYSLSKNIDSKNFSVIHSDDTDLFKNINSIKDL